MNARQQYMTRNRVSEANECSREHIVGTNEYVTMIQNPFDKLDVTRVKQQLQH